MITWILISLAIYFVVGLCMLLDARDLWDVGGMIFFAFAWLPLWVMDLIRRFRQGRKGEK